MARIAERLSQNVTGEFYVDDSCIDCDICRQIAPAVFDRSRAVEKSFVHRQPETKVEEQRALQALVACPTASIGTVHGLNAAAAARAFPEPIAGEVFFCGFAAEASFGATSYLIRRPEGNILVDSPRRAAPLMRRIDDLGGVSLMFLTHRDDVADHRAFHRRFGCSRILHRDDVTRSTVEVEVQPEGHDPIPLAGDLLVIPVPGHTAGSTALLYRDTFLFTGDHLWWSPERERLHASRDVCWYSWPEQKRSIERLLDHRFEWILPGHGRRLHAGSPEAMRSEIERLLAALGGR
jgi:glyoxylase-like metal-dependent hydrolase (beta-lactamase superfamily II)/ferredoxin